jgi:chromosome segregation ATPase
MTYRTRIIRIAAALVCTCGLALGAVPALEAEDLHAFEADDVIRAAEVNENFATLKEVIEQSEQLLQKRIAELEDENRALQARIAELQARIAALEEGAAAPVADTAKEEGMTAYASS